MEVQERVEDRTLSLSFSGEMDHHGVRNILRKIEMMIDATLPRVLTIDFSGVTFMDSSGIALILRSRQKMQLLKGEIILCHMPQQARRVLEVSGISQIITIQS